MGSTHFPPPQSDDPFAGSPSMRAKSVEGPAGLRRASMSPENLTDDWSLSGCAQVEWEGEMRPAMGGIPLLAKLGKGGMGYVYFGIEPDTGAEVAVKVLPRALQEQHKTAVQRFLREARLASELDQENIVRVQRMGVDEKTGAHYLVMECVTGITAGKWVDDIMREGMEGADEKEALDVIIASTRGLAAAHKEGIIHRDVKPENILLPVDEDGVVNHRGAKIADLGLARPPDDEGENLTQTSTALGTAGYMAPEQLEDAKNAREAADVFSMAATLYALLTGRAPFAAKSSIQAIMMTMQAQFPPIRERRPSVSDMTAEIITRCLKKDPAERYVNAVALLPELEKARAALG